MSPLKEQRFLWLCSPILEWQSLWHLSHMNDEGSCIEDALFLLFCLLAVSALALFSSRVANPSYTACRQAPRSAANSSHKSYTHHCNGEKTVLSCRYLSLGMRPSFIRPVWPSQRSLLCERSAYMLGILTYIKTQPLWQR